MRYGLDKYNSTFDGGPWPTKLMGVKADQLSYSWENAYLNHGIGDWPYLLLKCVTTNTIHRIRPKAKARALFCTEVVKELISKTT